MLGLGDARGAAEPERPSGRATHLFRLVSGAARVGLAPCLAAWASCFRAVELINSKAARRQEGQGEGTEAGDAVLCCSNVIDLYDASQADAKPQCRAQHYGYQAQEIVSGRLTAHVLTLPTRTSTRGAMPIENRSPVHSAPAEGARTRALCEVSARARP